MPLTITNIPVILHKRGRQHKGSEVGVRSMSRCSKDTQVAAEKDAD